ncbi:MAG: hypothetical protein O2816_03435 [Planctomycetota bacterium]|nr:hypothetical protein [Planctomycetota bacterium]
MDLGSLPIDIGAISGAQTSQKAQALAKRSDDPSAAADAGAKMEALFATMLVKELRKALPNEGFFGEGKGADVFNGWMDEFLGQKLADDGALDLAGRVKVALTSSSKSSGESETPKERDRDA